MEKHKGKDKQAPLRQRRERHRECEQRVRGWRLRPKRKVTAKSFRKQKNLETFSSNGTQHSHRPMLQLSDSIPEPYWATSEPPETQESPEMNKSVSKYVAAPQAPD